MGSNQGFSGGEKLAAKLKEIVDRLNKPNTLKVGFFEGAKYPDGTSVAMVAAIQNYGAPAVGIPPRPFFSNMVRTKKDGWADSLAAILAANNYDIDKSLRLLGEGIGSQLQQSIKDTNAPPLAKGTILARAKGSKRGKIKSATIAKPLIDTGHMMNSVGYQVDDGEVKKVTKKKVSS